jgi:hypothetical protein
VTRRRTLLLCALLGALIVVAAGLEGGGAFTGPRWVPDWNLAGVTPPTQQGAPLTQPSGLPQVPPNTNFSALPQILLWVVIGIAALILAFLLWRWYSRRPPRKSFGLREIGALSAPAPTPVAKQEPEPEPEAPVLLKGVERALRELDEEHEPADAIMRAWLGLQQTAEDSGILRRAAETPTEFTTRILRRVSADDRAVRTLLSLYLRTRFGDHPVTAADVVRARDALGALARSWDDRKVAGR